MESASVVAFANGPSRRSIQTGNSTTALSFSLTILAVVVEDVKNENPVIRSLAQLLVSSHSSGLSSIAYQHASRRTVETG
jgi:hypothetical protein